MLPPLFGQRPQCCAHALGSQIGRLSLWGQHQKAAVLHDQLEAFKALGGAPGNPPVPVLERIAGGSPHQQSHRLAVALDHLAQVIADRTARAQIVVIGQQTVEPGNLLRGGDADSQAATGEFGRRQIRVCFHRIVAQQKSRPVSSPIFQPSASGTSFFEAKDPVRICASAN